MSSRSVVLVDAGYLLAAGGELCLGTSNRAEMDVQFAPLVRALRARTAELAYAPHLRTYWYDASRDSLPSSEHVELEQIPRVRLRLGRLDQGRQKGVDALVHNDLMRLAAQTARIETVFLVSGDEDVLRGLQETQDQAVEVILLTVRAAGSSRASRSLIASADEHVVLDEEFLGPFFRSRMQENARIPDRWPQLEKKVARELMHEPYALGRELGRRWLKVNPPSGRMLESLPRLPQGVDRMLLLTARDIRGDDLSELERRDLRAGFGDALREFHLG